MWRNVTRSKPRQKIANLHSGLIRQASIDCDLYQLAVLQALLPDLRNIKWQQTAMIGSSANHVCYNTHALANAKTGY